MNPRQQKLLFSKIKKHFKNAKNCISCINSKFNMNDYDLENMRICSQNEFVLIVKKDSLNEESKFIYDLANDWFAEIVDYN
jgi:hypothetical protein